MGGAAARRLIGGNLSSMAARRSMRSAVVIPNWNGARWLVGCLDAVAAQTRAADEVVVVDNGSSDDSLAILAGASRRARG